VGSVEKKVYLAMYRNFPDIETTGQLLPILKKVRELKGQGGRQQKYTSVLLGAFPNSNIFSGAVIIPTFCFRILEGLPLTGGRHVRHLHLFFLLCSL
jgi:hypothetical protein